MNKIVCFIISIVSFLFIVRTPANADWINLSGAQNAPNIAEIYINDDHVKIEIEIFVKDLVTFDRLIPDKFFAGTKIKRAPLEERMQQFSNEDLQVITASKGVFSYLAKPMFHSLKLIDAHVFTKIPDDTDFSAKFGTFTLWLPAQTPQPPGYKVKSATTVTLMQSPVPVDRAEFQWRMSTPLSALLLALAAIPLSRSRPRQGRYAKMLLAIGIFIAYKYPLDRKEFSKIVEELKIRRAA